MPLLWWCRFILLGQFKRLCFRIALLGALVGQNMIGFVSDGRKRYPLKRYPSILPPYQSPLTCTVYQFILRGKNDLMSTARDNNIIMPAVCCKKLKPRDNEAPITPYLLKPFHHLDDIIITNNWKGRSKLLFDSQRAGPKGAEWNISRDFGSVSTYGQ